uniref:Uncharacterized protein n=1 Tax=Lactuca sativa TaxID=4236 RepID=A0A9R1VDR8_LACSA|nr:hypothetical protein LSAT_V11C500253090 [Lactuca sativa]
MWFDEENPKNNARGGNCHKEILTIHHKQGRTEHAGNISSIREAMRGLTFSTTDPRSLGWRVDDPLVIQGSIRYVTIHLLYVDIGCSMDIIYEHYIWLLPDKWKEGLKPTPC